MALPTGLNDLAKLTLLASDASYFKTDLTGSVLAALPDTTYGVAPQYSVPSGYVAVAQGVDPNTGFGFIAYQNQQTNEVIVAMRGTDGPNPQDWVANSQYLGWNQWNTQNAGRSLVFGFLNGLTNPDESPFTGEIHFTGQSLGGGLAQYAAYEYVRDHKALAAQNNTTFDASRITLTTFNGLGGVLGLQYNLGNYSPAVLADIGSNAHFYTEGDLVSRLGSFGGVGHTGGTAYFLSIGSKEIDPDTGEPFLLNGVDAHRIETGFYPFLSPGTEFEVAVARPIDYLPMQNVQQIASLFGRVLNDQDVSPVESLPRLAAGLIAALSLGNPTETNALVQAVLTNLHSADNMSDEWYVALRSLDWEKIAQNSAFQIGASTGYGVTLLGAILSDALQFQVERHVQLFKSLRDWVSSGISTPDLQISSEDRRLQMDMLFSLIPGAAIGSRLAPLLQPLAVDVEGLAQRMLSGGANWVSDTFTYLRATAQTTLADTKIGGFVVKLASVFADMARDSGMTDLTLQSYLDNEIIPFIHDTANGMAKAVSEFVQDIPNTFFNFGRTISNLADIQLIDQAYAAELSDPQLSPLVRAAAKEAHQTFQRAGQTVVIQKGVGANPFHTAGFVPGGASSATVEERLGEQFRLSLPFAAEAGGQRISLQLQGPQVNQLSVLTADGVQAIGANGAFELTVPEGADQIYFTLNASDDMSFDASVTLSATLVDTVTGVATHTPQVESVVSVKAFVGNTEDGYEAWIEDYSHITDPSISLPLGVGGFYHQTLHGGEGPDSLNFWQGFGDDTLYGNGGDDWILGGYGHDRLYGGAGNDRLLADPYDYHPDPIPRPTLYSQRPTLDGKDYADGGDGNDRIGGGGNDDRLIGGAGDDEIWGDALTRGTEIENPDGSQTFVSLTGVLVPGSDVLEGGDGNDYLSGDGGDDTLDGGIGDDVLWGDTETSVSLLIPMAPGDDFLSGGAGNDQLSGGAEDDVLLGGSGNDLLFGDDEGVGVTLQGDDWLEGGDGNDQLAGFGGDDVLLGGAGTDALFGGDGDDALDGGAGDDVGFGGAGDDGLSGGAGDDQFDGEAGGDVMFGDEGNDLLIGGDGLDTLDGGAGDDLLVGNADTDTVFGGDGIDELQGGLGNDFLAGDAGDDRLLGEEGDDELFGGDGNDGLRGDDGADQLDGGAGDDTLVGDADGQIGGTGGSDVLIGGAGNDTLVGGGGQDTYFFDSGDGFDVIVDAAGEGNRLVFGAGIGEEDLSLSVAAGSLVVRLGSSAQTVTIGGFDAANVEGASGVDTYHFADGTVLSHEQLVARGFAFTGSVGNDTLTGVTNGFNRLVGGVGDDTYIVNHVTDQVFEASSEGIDAVYTSVDFMLPDFVENLFAAVPEGSSSAPVALTGNNLSNMIQALPGLPTDNRLQGRGGNDQISTFEGNDILEGGAGDDTLDGGLGSDIYVFGVGDGVDVVIDQSTPGTDIDTIQFGPGVAPSDVRVRLLQGQEPNEFERAVELGLGVDKMILRNASIEQMTFVDGSIWDAVAIEARTEGLTLRASQTGSSLFGTVYRDTLIGEGGDDFLDGNENADRMAGGAGDDRYQVDHVDDTVEELDREGTDTVHSLIDYTLPDHVENLLLHTTAQSTTDPVRGEGNASANLLLGNFVSNLLIGGAGADTLWGGYSIGNEYGLGDDDLNGGAGNDTYVIEGSFNGFDAIHDVALPGEGNRLQFGNSVHPDDVVFVQEGSALRITNAGGMNGATLMDFDPSGTAGSPVTEFVAFSAGVEDITGGYETRLLALMNPTVGTDNGETMAGTSQTDVIKARGGDDVIAGGAGNDVLIGGAGNDTYIFNQGDGFDLIDDQSGTGDVNLVQFGAGITQDMLQVSYSGTSSIGGLTVRVGMSGDGLHFLGVSAEDPGAPHAIDTFSFADGTHLSFVQLFDREVLVQGTGRSDGELFGTVADDRMVGLVGSESLSSGAGSDTLTGGPGNDVLDGGEGGDTYVFNPGDGIDEIRDDIGDPAFPDVNRLRFGTGITASDLTLFTNGDGITVNRVAVGTSGDEISLPNFADFIPALAVAEFADGVTLDLYNLYAANLRTDNQTIVGGEGELVLIGGTGNDTILGWSSTSTLLGGMGDDVLVGADGTNFLMGGRGNDFIQGGSGNDTYLFNMGDGLDTIDDVAAVGEGNRIQFGADIRQADLTTTRDEAARTLTIQVGASGADRLVLTNFDSTGVNGSLVVETLAFADGSTASMASLLGPSITIFGTAGAEVLVGTAGNDGIDAGAGNDAVYGNGGDDLILAGEDDDSVTGDEGADTISGGGGTDYLYGGAGNDIINGDDGNDTLVGDVGNDVLNGGLGNDVLNGGAGVDQLVGGEGDDTLYIDAADTVANGGAGYDVVSVLGAEAITFNATAAEVELVVASSGNDVVTAVGSATGVTIYGGDGNDQLTGGDGTEVLIGEAGADTLLGGAGNDVLNGGLGDDVLTGEAGDDAFYAETGDDQIQGGEGSDSVSGDEGTDTIYGGTGVDYLYGGDGDDVINGDEGNDTLVGDAGTDSLMGGAGNDVLNGGAGADQLTGGEGDDALYIDAADTLVVGGVGYDQVIVTGIDAVTFDAAAAEVELVVGGSGDDVVTAVGSLAGVTFYGGEGHDQLTGGDGNDVLIGEAGHDTVIGGVGNDVLNGGVGDDTLSGGSGEDAFYAGAGNDLISGGDGTDSVSGDEGNDVIAGGADGDYLYGGMGDDVLNGDAGNDVLVGEADHDTLVGGAGNDRLVGGRGNDVYRFGLGGGSDVIAEDDSTAGNQDLLQFDSELTPLDLVISQQANDLRIAIHGTTDQILLENWFQGEDYQVETIEAGAGGTLLNAQVDQLIQAMATFSNQTGLTWDQAIDQRPQDVQTVLAASWH
ncbi:MAG: hypothetical protein LZF86_220002 [Nitrospira sp.]|nr:MAG: hypothetical protein LZF86_220002 [Nitrospira sp.]